MADAFGPWDEDYRVRADAAGESYVAQVMRRGRLTREQAEAYIDSLPMGDVPWGARGKSAVRRVKREMAGDISLPNRYFR